MIPCDDIGSEPQGTAAACSADRIPSPGHLPTTMPIESTFASSAAPRRGTKPDYAEAARRVGTAPGRSGLGLVYGGGRVGLMGIVADAVLVPAAG